jgi:hypothetical protein
MQFHGYDLASLTYENYSTLGGRILLFSQKQRQFLSKKSNTYENMFETINTQQAN